jgi:MYXO-CTERM domain-containing protein
MRSETSLVALGVGLSLLVALPERAAEAYCRTSFCSTTMATGEVCVPAAPGDCGIELFWPSPCTGFSVQEDGSKKLGITAAETEALATTAFHNWINAPCTGGGTPSMTVTEFTPAVCHVIQYNPNACNDNVIMFDDDSWPYEGSPNVLALTTVTYALDTGQIYDADMELNSADNVFTTGVTDVQADLPSILQHETGHFLGLAHSKNPTATMYPVYNPGSTSLRQISADDIAAICATYPPGTSTSGCDPTPRHGFSTECAGSQTDCTGGSSDETSASASSGCCSVAPGSEAPDRGYGGLAAAIGLAFLSVRRARARWRGAQSPR